MVEHMIAKQFVPVPEDDDTSTGTSGFRFGSSRRILRLQGRSGMDGDAAVMSSDWAAVPLLG